MGTSPISLIRGQSPHQLPRLKLHSEGIVQIITVCQTSVYQQQIQPTEPRVSIQLEELHIFMEVLSCLCRVFLFRPYYIANTAPVI